MDPSRRSRLRIWFRKEADLRFISHRDLARLWERMLRRAGLSLAMSEGFHPKARMSFPSALGLGLASRVEIVEVELVEEIPVEDAERRLRGEAPDGLTIDRIDRLPPGAPKAHIVRATYEVDLPPDRQADVRTAIAELLARGECPVDRPDRDGAVEIRADIERLDLVEGRLTMTLAQRREASARPRDILSVLGLADIEAAGAVLTRVGSEFG